jgi:hypothetical protein
MTSTAAETPHVLPESDAHRRALAREFFAAALYMALVLLAALVAFPVTRLPSDEVVVATLVGTALGLILAHWLAFRLAAHLTDEGGMWSGSAPAEAGAQIVGGVGVAVIASLPFVVLSGADALRISLLLLAALPALTGLAIARLRGRSWLTSGIAAAIVFVIAVAIVEIKAAVGH